jgi:hypothetical protein
MDAIAVNVGNTARAGWNYAVRPYRPRAEILDGTWSCPALVPSH